jgi:uncharacterized membrane protein YozB (DUF420 family)
MSAFLSLPGFLGTRATLVSDLTLVLIVLTAILFTIGRAFALRKNYKVHRIIQTTSAILNSIVVIVVMITSFVKHILPGIPAKLLEGSYGVTTIHGIIGLFGLVLGIIVTLRGNEFAPKPLRFNNYKKYMRLSYWLYMTSTIVKENSIKGCSMYPVR